jgi:hypothetical protein
MVEHCKDIKFKMFAAGKKQRRCNQVTGVITMPAGSFLIT